MAFFLGLTGGIATGKSTAVSVFQSFNIKVFDADVIAKSLQDEQSVIFEQITTAFPESLNKVNNSIDRKQLATTVFSCSEKLLMLDEIMQPFLKKEFEKIRDFTKKSHDKLVILDIPLLFEKHYTYLFDKTMLIFAPQELQLARLTKRNNLSNAAALQRINSQINIDKKIELADFVILNVGTTSELKETLKQWLLSYSFI